MIYFIHSKIKVFNLVFRAFNKKNFQIVYMILIGNMVKKTPKKG